MQKFFIHKIIIISIAVIGIGYASYFLLPKENISPLPAGVLNNINNNAVTTNEDNDGKTNVATQNIKSSLVALPTNHASNTKSAIQKNKTAKLIIADKEFLIEIQSDNETVAEAMNKLQNVGLISFTSREYYGMGIFFTSISNIANTKDEAWFLYINETKSARGASHIVIHPGDTVAWKYEKIIN